MLRSLYSGSLAKCYDYLSNQLPKHRSSAIQHLLIFPNGHLSTDRASSVASRLTPTCKDTKPTVVLYHPFNRHLNKGLLSPTKL
jgi:hypothetical protein